MPDLKPDFDKNVKYIWEYDRKLTNAGIHTPLFKSAKNYKLNNIGRITSSMVSRDVKQNYPKISQKGNKNNL